MIGLMFLLLIFGGLILPAAPVLAGVSILGAAYAGTKLADDYGEVFEMVMFYGAIASILIVAGETVIA